MMIIKKIRDNKLMFTVATIYLFLFIFFPEKGMNALSNTSYYLKEMLQILPVIFVLTVTIEAWVPKELITKRLGANAGIIGNVLSIILGSISAGPIYAAFPICKMLLKKGASISNIVIILSSWAVIKVPMLANEAKFLGVKFMFVRWILTVVAILIIAKISSIIIKEKDVSEMIKEESDQGFDIKEEYCIGCGICEKLLPDYFEIYDKKVRLKSNSFDIDVMKEIIDKCPTKAIRYYG